jgi:hypothetical protein
MLYVQLFTNIHAKFKLIHKEKKLCIVSTQLQIKKHDSEISLGCDGVWTYFLLITSHIHLLDLQHEVIVVGEIVKTMASFIAIPKQVVLFFIYLSLERRFVCS